MGGRLYRPYYWNLKLNAIVLFPGLHIIIRTQRAKEPIIIIYSGTSLIRTEESVLIRGVS